MWICTRCQSECEEHFGECWNCSARKPGSFVGIEWFEPESNLTVVIPESLLTSWRGGESATPGVPGKDWTRAAEVSNWIGITSSSTGECLVLAQDAPVAAFVQRDSHLYILRWLCAEDEEMLLAIFESDTNSTSEQEAIEFNHPGGRLVMIDALHSGSEIAYKPLAADLSGGKYLVETFVLQSGATKLLAHHFHTIDQITK